MSKQTKEESVEEIEGRFKRIGRHFRDNKDRYGCLILGAGVATLVLSRGNKQVIVNAFQWKPVIWIAQISMPAGHYREAIAVRCTETGEQFASMARAAKANGVNVGELSRHVNGKLDEVKGLHFEKA
jgi:hypothetical protein